MTRLKKISLLFLLIGSIFSCNRGSCPLSAGAAVTETRVVAGFNEIVLYDKINLILTQDSAQTLQIRGGKHLLAGIQTQVLDSVLTIRNGNGCNWLRNPDYQINVYISSPQWQKISYYGAGEISSTNTLIAPQFTVDSWYGTGPVTLSLLTRTSYALVRNNNASIRFSGQTDSSFIYCGQEGSVNQVDLAASYLSVDSKSIENIYVNVSGSLHATIAYKGNVYYQGNPSQVDTLIVNSGRLIHLP